MRVCSCAVPLSCMSTSAAHLTPSPVLLALPPVLRGLRAPSMEKGLIDTTGAWDRMDSGLDAGEPPGDVGGE
jgi:hypothetical protein